jgi:hypothetical protein
MLADFSCRNNPGMNLRGNYVFLLDYIKVGLFFYFIKTNQIYCYEKRLLENTATGMAADVTGLYRSGG